MASRFWRLSGFGLFAGVALGIRTLRLGASETLLAPQLTCSHAPSEGALDNILDDDPHSICKWDAAVISLPGFYIAITFSESTEITSVELDIAEGGVSDLALHQKVNDQWIVAMSEWFGASESVELGLPSTYQQTVLADGPTTYIPCSDASGDALDIRGGTAGFSVSSFAVRRARKLTSRGHAIAMPSIGDNWPLLAAKNAQVGNLQGDISLEMLVQGVPLPNVGISRIITKEIGGQYWPEYRLSQEGENLVLLVRYANDNASRAVDQAVKVNLLDGKRHHVVLTKLQSRYRLYVDGVAVMDATATQAPLTGLGVLGICGDYLIPGYLSSPFNGAVMGVALYDKALSGEKIAQHVASLGPMPNRVLRTAYTSPLMLPGDRPADGLSVQLHQPLQASDMEFGGSGRLYGTVTRKSSPSNTPLACRVRLHRSRDGALVRETWSKPDGSYEFCEISTRYEWDVIAWDHELQEYSTVANNQLAEVA